jgi:hypothetical protein
LYALAKRSWVLVLLCALLGANEHVRAAVYTDEAVKAAFLHRFAAYIDWPAAATSDTPFTIAVASGDGVAAELERLLPGRTIQNRPAQVRRVTAVDHLEGVSILYIGAGSLHRARPLIAAAGKRPILIVTDDEGGLEQGGIINFLQVRRNIRMEISLSAAERHGLKINSGLLAVAVRVEGRPQADTHCDGMTFSYALRPACSYRFARRSEVRGPAARTWRS